MPQNLFSAPKPTPRFLALLVPSFATDRLRRAAPAETAPLVLYEKAKGALRLSACDDAARAAGLWPGQPLAEARAVFPRLDARPADPAGDARAFRRLALGLSRWSPFVGVPGTGEAVLDVAGVAHLFGGEAALCDDAVRRLAGAGWRARAGLASTPGAAFAAAFAGLGVVAPGEERGRLAGLPVESLRLEEACTEGLRRLGLKRIGQLYDLPRAPLAARFGPLLLRRLDQALGAEEEPIEPIAPPPDYAAEARLVEPVSSAEAVEAILDRLARDLERRLARDGAGGRRFELALYAVDHRMRRLAVGAARPVRGAAHVLRLFKNRIEAVYDPREAGFGYDMARLSAYGAEPLHAAPLAFAALEKGRPDETGRDGDGGLCELQDALASRLGESAVRRPVVIDAHLPEKAGAFVGAASPRPGALLPSAAHRQSRDRPDERTTDRPLLLLPAPEPIDAVAAVPDGAPSRFVWRRVARRVVRARGPERIAAEWLARPAPAPTRDYYAVEDAEGRRFWVYREGLYERETARPRWFLHGVFA